jgi:predicted tellurium resistance membrane protein TerC
LLSELSALFQVIMVDLVLAGDNAIVVGIVAAGLPRAQRSRVILIGIAAADAFARGLRRSSPRRFSRSSA